MYSYVAGLLFIVFYILFMYLVGSAFYKKEGSYPSHFIVGYLIFSFFVAIGGIPIQLLNLPWLVFVGYMVIVYVGLFYWAISRLKKQDKKIVDSSKIKEFIKNQWFVVCIAFILVIVSCSNIESVWMNNALDDGYYLGWVSGVPYGINGFFTHPSTGYASTRSAMFSYLLNTTYSEYGLYVFLLHVRTTVFCRVFMDFFNYFLFGMVITRLAEGLFHEMKLDWKAHRFQFFASILFLFSMLSFYHLSGTYSLNGVFVIQDSWQFNTAMYYGSNIVRTCGILLLSMFFFDKPLSVRVVLGVIGISIALVSKSSIVFPIIVLVSYAYVLSYLVCENKKQYRWIAAVLVVLYLIASILVGNRPSISAAANALFVQNLSFIPFWIVTLLFLLSFVFRNKTINKINGMMIILWIFMFINPLDNIFELFSQYNFVASRMMANFIYTLIALSFIYLCIFVAKYLRIKVFKASLVYVLTIVLFITFLNQWKAFMYSNKALKNPDHIMDIMLDNKYVVPTSTILLGDVLEQRYHETKRNNVVFMPEGSMVNKQGHSIATLLRTVSPHTISLSATGRYGQDKVGEYQAFSKKDQSNMDAFITNPNDQTYQAFSKSIKRSKADCIVFSTGDFASYLKKDGFSLYKGIEDPKNKYNYYVYVRD